MVPDNSLDFRGREEGADPIERARVAVSPSFSVAYQGMSKEALRRTLSVVVGSRVRQVAGVVRSAGR